jgi:hypothetical protein
MPISPATQHPNEDCAPSLRPIRGVQQVRCCFQSGIDFLRDLPPLVGEETLPLLVNVQAVVHDYAVT